MNRRHFVVGAALISLFSKSAMAQQVTHEDLERKVSLSMLEWSGSKGAEKAAVAYLNSVIEYADFVIESAPLITDAEVLAGMISNIKGIQATMEFVIMDSEGYSKDTAFLIVKAQRKLFEAERVAQAALDALEQSKDRQKELMDEIGQNPSPIIETLEELGI